MCNRTCACKMQRSRLTEAGSTRSDGDMSDSCDAILSLMLLMLIRGVCYVLLSAAAAG